MRSIHGKFTGRHDEEVKQNSNISVLAVFDYYDQSPVEAIDRSMEALNYSRYSPKYPNAAVFPALTGEFVGLTSWKLLPTQSGIQRGQPHTCGLQQWYSATIIQY